MEHYQEYCRDRSEILEHRSISVQLLDKTLLTINTGAFIVSFTYVFQLFNKGIAHAIILLILGWAAMAAAILANIVAQFIACQLCDWRLDENDLAYKQESGQGSPQELELLRKIRRRNQHLDTWANILSKSQILVTGASIVLIIIFVSINAYMFPN